MNKAMRLFYFAYFLFVPFSAFAYLDPGTGSLLVYALIGAFASLMFALRNLWYWFLEKLLSGRSGAAPHVLPDIVFHSEGGRYWQVFEPVISALMRKNVPCAYVTPDASDPAILFSRSFPLLAVVRPGNELMTVAFLNRMRTKLVVSTTPNLDVFMWKRSSGVSRYVHLFHSPTSIEFYEKFSLSFYDDILTAGLFQEKAINYLDDARNLPRKRFFPAGLTYFDYMLREAAVCTRKTGTFTVLYAPSWGARSSLVRYGSHIIDMLVDISQPVIFRPHPQSSISDHDILAVIEKKYKGHPLVTIDLNRTGTQSMTDSDVLVTDLSGMLFDYAFLFSRPVILASSDAPVGGYEAEDISGTLWDVESACALSSELSGGPDCLPAVLSGIRENYADETERSVRFRNANFYHFGTAGESTASQLLSILGALN